MKHPRYGKLFKKRGKNMVPVYSWASRKIRVVNGRKVGTEPARLLGYRKKRCACCGKSGCSEAR